MGYEPAIWDALQNITAMPGDQNPGMADSCNGSFERERYGSPKLAQALQDVPFQDVW